MTKATFTAIFALLLALTTATAGTRQRGQGCWRTATARQQAASRMASERPVETGQSTNYRGQKRALVILCEFPETKFKAGHDREKYYDILNESDYATSEGFRGSVADYFKVQSSGLFKPHFDIYGPVKIASSCTANGTYGKTAFRNATALLADSLQADLTPEGTIHFQAESDALIVKGIVALLIRVLDQQTPADILAADLHFIEDIGLKEHLSPTRSNGLLAMLKQMKLYAMAFQAKMA